MYGSTVWVFVKFENWIKFVSTYTLKLQKCKEAIKRIVIVTYIFGKDRTYCHGRKYFFSGGKKSETCYGKWEKKGRRKTCQKKKRMEEMERSKPNRIRRQIRGGKNISLLPLLLSHKRKKGKNFISIFLLLFFLLGIYIRRGKDKDTTFCECVIAAKVRFKKSRRQGKYFP